MGAVLGRIEELNGIAVCFDPALPTVHNVFYRKPRTRRKRVLAKWRARVRNWRDEPLSLIYMVNAKSAVPQWTGEVSASQSDYDRTVIDMILGAKIKLDINAQEHWVACNALGLERIKEWIPDKDLLVSLMESEKV